MTRAMKAISGSLSALDRDCASLVSGAIFSNLTAAKTRQDKNCPGK